MFLTLSAYKFIPLSRLSLLQAQLKQECERLALNGTVLLAPEGINFTLSGTREKMAAIRSIVESIIDMTDVRFKESQSLTSPFRRLIVKIKPEIVTMGMPNICHQQPVGQYLAPHEFKRWLDDEREILLLDVRNRYEIEQGKFTQAIHLGIKHFREFPKAVSSLSLEEKTVVMYCTGGIRCEKASAYLKQEGFQDVHQLHGGILSYFEECGSHHYEGNCFVFDERLSLNEKLEIASE